MGPGSQRCQVTHGSVPASVCAFAAGAETGIKLSANASPICRRVAGAITTLCARPRPADETPGSAYRPHGLFLRGALTDEIADDHESGGDADPHGQRLVHERSQPRER